MCIMLWLGLKGIVLHELGKTPRRNDLPSRFYLRQKIEENEWGSFLFFFLTIRVYILG